MNDPMRDISTGAQTGADPAQADAYRLARRRVRMLQGWYVHALVYACVIGTLWLVYGLAGQSRFPWPLPPMLGWGLGLAIHGLVVWLGTSRRSRDWQSRKIEQYVKDELASRGGERR